MGRGPLSDLALFRIIYINDLQHTKGSRFGLAMICTEGLPVAKYAEGAQGRKDLKSGTTRKKEV